VATPVAAFEALSDQNHALSTVDLVTTPNPLVAVDLFGTNRAKITGWERYALNLYQALVDAHPSDLTLWPLKRGAAGSSRFDHLRRALTHYFFSTRHDLAGTHPRVFHATTFPPGFVPRHTKVVWTVHDDLILGGHREFARRGAVIWNRLAQARLARVDAFVTSTQTVRRELVALGVPEEKIHLVSAPSNPLPAATNAPSVTHVDGSPAMLPSQFVLVVGTLEPRKRVDLASRIAARAGLPILLVGHRSNVDLSTLAPGTLLASGVSDGELAWCYENASALLSASAYEGINMPLFEAAERGLQVVASNIDVHRELAGEYIDRVALVDPINEDLAASVLAERVAVGRVAPREILATYATLAEQHLAIYRSLLD